jgi:hypothetical protein
MNIESLYMFPVISAGMRPNDTSLPTKAWERPVDGSEDPTDPTQTFTYDFIASFDSTGTAVFAKETMTVRDAAKSNVPGSANVVPVPLNIYDADGNLNPLLLHNRIVKDPKGGLPLIVPVPSPSAKK